MLRIIDYIEITFENLDYIRIPAGYFKDVKIKDIDMDIRKEKHGLELAFTVANTVLLKLKPETDEDASVFEGDIFGLEQGRISLFERIRKCDITQIDIVCSENARYELRAVWEDGADEYHNLYQSVEAGSDGGLTVRIENPNR